MSDKSTPGEELAKEIMRQDFEQLRIPDGLCVFPYQGDGKSSSLRDRIKEISNN